MIGSVARAKTIRGEGTHTVATIPWNPGCALWNAVIRVKQRNDNNMFTQNILTPFYRLCQLRSRTGRFPSCPDLLLHHNSKPEIRAAQPVTNILNHGECSWILYHDGVRAAGVGRGELSNNSSSAAPSSTDRTCCCCCCHTDPWMPNSLLQV